MADPDASDSLAPLAPGKKVLFVTPVAPWNLFGGTPTVSRNLIALFSEALDLQVCCLRSDEPGDYPRQDHGATVLTGRVPGLSRKLKFFFDFRSDSFAHRQFQRAAVRARFAALLAELRPEVVIFDHIYSSWLIDLIEDPAVRVVYIAHDDMVAFADSIHALGPSLAKRLRFAALRRQYGWLQEKVLDRSDLTLTMTPEDADRIRVTARGPVQVAPLHFEFSDFAREYPAEFRYLLVTGSFDTWEKKLGVARFLTTVFVPLVARRPELRLMIAGRVSEDLQQQFPFAEPQIRVVQAPSDAEMREVVQQASAAVVLDLQASGLKIKTMEFAAAGLPLVSWRPGLEGTQLVPGESCLRAETAAEFVDHLDRLYMQPELRKRLGTAAREVTQAGFSIEAARARLQMLARELMGTSRQES
jgi:glycosyltransferase involved in cell wall biosynthesis